MNLANKGQPFYNTKIYQTKEYETQHQKNHWLTSQARLDGAMTKKGCRKCK